MKAILRELQKPSHSLPPSTPHRCPHCRWSLCSWGCPRSMWAWRPSCSACWGCPGCCGCPSAPAARPSGRLGWSLAPPPQRKSSEPSWSLGQRQGGGRRGGLLQQYSTARLLGGLDREGGRGVVPTDLHFGSETTI